MNGKGGAATTMGDQKPRVCRRLQFDDEPAGEDHTGAVENYENELKEEMRRDAQAAMLRWNFDFENEVPLPGRWLWVRVETNPAIQAETPPSLQNVPASSGNEQTIEHPGDEKGIENQNKR
ncbi:hypothetical protein C0J52_01934 [Blattella germanica]|nr:hypothetical protein C0J52_01934 [Blattella germanica]